MSRFYDAMRRAFEDEEPLVRDEESAEPPPVPAPTSNRGVLEQDVDESPVESIEPFTIPDIQFVEPVPIRPAPEASKGATKSIHPSHERIIQRLLAFRGGRRHCVVLVASAVSGEGASTVCRNIAEALNKSQKGTVVLVDANLRRPAQNDALELGAGKGLAELLSSEAKLKSVIQVDNRSGLAVLASGAIHDSPQQLFTVPRLQSLVTSLHSQYDWIFIDGPPVTTCPELSSLAIVADGAILVLRAEQTRWEVAEEAKKILNQAGVSILGGVLNRRKYHIPNFIYRRL